MPVGVPAAAFGDNVVLNNTLGWTRRNADGSIRDTNDAWFPDCVDSPIPHCNPNDWRSNIGLADIQAELTRWQARLDAAGIVPGPVATGTSLPMAHPLPLLPPQVRPGQAAPRPLIVPTPPHPVRPPLR